MPTPSAAAPTSATGVCPNCGAAIPPDAVQGLCPKCLVAAINTGTQGLATAPVVPALEAVAAKFPHLEILGLIGAGGMGAVFKARQPKLNRFVALKILPESLGDDPMFAERFAREGQLLARLSHPNIVTVHDFGQAGGFYYLLMEYVDGVNLREAMRASRFTAAQALSIVPRICEALQFAHEEGVLHRDIKPENILLDSKGRVKLADFGIAKMIADAEAPGSPAVAGASGLTQVHGTLGTPQYMAPEQRNAPAEVDHRADIYSLGVVFYELLTGELPAGNFPPPSARSDADPRLDAIVRQAMEQEPRRRQRTAGEVKTQIETVVRDPARPSTASSPSGPAKLALGFLLAGILVPLLLLTFYRMNDGGVALTGACFLLAVIFGVISRREWLGKMSARVGGAIPVLVVVTIAVALLVTEWHASRRAIQAANLAREAERRALFAHEALRSANSRVSNLSGSGPPSVPYKKLEAESGKPMPASDEREQLEGDWQMIAQRVSGRDTTDADAGVCLTFTGDRMIRRQRNGSQSESGFRFRPEANPKELDLISDGANGEPVLQLGIYRFDGDKLIMSFNRADPTKRPLGYVSQPENSIVVTTLQRLPRTEPAPLEKSAPDRP